jgi:hypothetical protein
MHSSFDQHLCTCYIIHVLDYNVIIMSLAVHLVFLSQIYHSKFYRIFWNQFLKFLVQFLRTVPHFSHGTLKLDLLNKFWFSLKNINVPIFWMSRFDILNGPALDPLFLVLASIIINLRWFWCYSWLNCVFWLIFFGSCLSSTNSFNIKFPSHRTPPASIFFASTYPSSLAFVLGYHIAIVVRNW